MAARTRLATCFLPLAALALAAALAGCGDRPAPAPDPATLFSVLDFPAPVPPSLVERFAEVCREEAAIRQGYWAARGPRIRERLLVFLDDGQPLVVAAALGLARRAPDAPLAARALELLAHPAREVRRAAALLANDFYVVNCSGAPHPAQSALIFWTRVLALAQADYAQLGVLAGLPARHLDDQQWLRLYNLVLAALAPGAAAEEVAAGAAAFARDLLAAACATQPVFVRQRLESLSQLLRRERRPLVLLTLLAALGQVAPLCGIEASRRWPGEANFYFRREWELIAPDPAAFLDDPAGETERRLGGLMADLARPEGRARALAVLNGLARSVCRDFFAARRAAARAQVAAPDADLARELAAAGLDPLWLEGWGAP